MKIATSTTATPKRIVAIEPTIATKIVNPVDNESRTNVCILKDGRAGSIQLVSIS